MNYLLRFLALMILLVASKSVFAQNVQGICSSSPVPAGWIVTNEAWSPTTCGNPATLVLNAITITEYDNLPVGATMEACIGGVPAGWAVTSQSFSGLYCGGQYSGNVLSPTIMSIKHLSCVNESQSLCYPSPPPVQQPPTGTISASPTTVYVPYDQAGSTTISYSTANLSGSACINVSMDGAAETPMYCGGTSGTSTPNWIVAGHQYAFRLYQQTGNVTLGSITVKGISDGTPTLTVSPSVVGVPAGKTGSTTVVWNAPGYNQVGILVSTNGGPYNAWTVGNGSAGSAVWTYLQGGDVVTFEIVPVGQNSTVLASATASAFTPTITATPNPVHIPAGQTSAPVTITSNAPGYTSVSWYGSNSLPPYNGEIMCLGSNVPTSHTYNGSMGAGETAKIYLVPNDNCAGGTVVGSVPGTVLSSVTITTQ